MITRHLLWSGGWDSTFRLLYTLLVRNEAVQPHYVINTKRKSVVSELRAQARISNQFKLEYPHAASRFYPTRIAERTTLPKDATTTTQYRNLRPHYHVGPQYEWLALYARHIELDTRIDPLEMCIIARGSFDQELGSQQEMVDVHGENQLRFIQNPNNPNLKMFRHFSMPTQIYDKVQMLEIAKMHSFSHLLYLSRFCHKPMPNDLPCGVCKPCLDARQLGMTHRLHPLSHLRYHLYPWIENPTRKIIYKTQKILHTSR